MESAMFSRRRMLLGCITLRRSAGALRRHPSALWLGARPAGHRGRALRRHAAAAHPCRQRYHRRPDGLAVRDALLAYLDAHCTASTQPEARVWAAAHLPDLQLAAAGAGAGGQFCTGAGCSWWKCTSIPRYPTGVLPAGRYQAVRIDLARHPTAGTGGAYSTPACAVPACGGYAAPPKTTSSAGSTSCGSSAWKHGRDAPPAAGTRSSSAAVKSRPFPALHKLIVEGV